MNNLLFNKNEGRLRALPRVLLQIALLFMLIPGIHSLVEGAVRSCCSSNTATLILGYDSSQFIVMFVSVSISVLLCVLFLDKRRFSDLGVVKEKCAGLDYLYGFFLAAILVAAMLLMELFLGAAQISSNNISQLRDGRFLLGIMDGLAACLMIGFQEELLRFYQIKNFSEGLSGFKPLGKRGAVIVATVAAAVFFGCLHMGNNGITPLAVLMLALDGLFLSLIYITTGSAWLAFGFHAGWDFAEGNLFGFPVSGYPETYSLLKVKETGAVLLTGGAFGPDGGLINWLMIALATLSIMAWIHLRHRQLKLRTDLCKWVSGSAAPLSESEQYS